MWRTVGAVILGYAVMFVLVFVTFSAAYIGMGAERAFKPQSYEVSGLWIAASIGFSLIAAVLGGWVTSRVAGSAGAVKSLAVVVVFLGLLMALPAFMGPPGPDLEPRTAEVGNMEAMQKAKPPSWVSFLTPLIGAVGVMTGGWRRARSG